MKSLTVSKVNIDLAILHECVKKYLRNKEIQILSWQISPIKSRTQNFTTAGIYRVHGVARVKEKDLPWSLIVKIIRPEAEEKNNPKHFNYWKREVLVFGSGLLNELPSAIQTPECYKIEEKSEEEIWLWLEEIMENNSRLFSLEDFSYIAKQMGLFQGAFASGKYPLPEEKWISQNWLTSWINGCDLYAPKLSGVYPKVKESNTTIDTILKNYHTLRQAQKKYLQKLNDLPRVLSHHDLSKQNMYISDKNQRFILIDWQYLGVSGLGEDIGRLFGLAVSQGDIPIAEAWEWQKQLFDSYIEGLSQAGWNENPLLARYGFCMALSFRSAWEVPKLFKLLAENKSAEQIEKYTQIALIQLGIAEEATAIFETI